MSNVLILLRDAFTDCLTFRVGIDGQIDYEGQNVEKTEDALKACDEIELELLDDEGEQLGWALIVQDREGLEIVDCSGWIDNWLG